MNDETDVKLVEIAGLYVLYYSADHAFAHAMQDPRARLIAPEQVNVAWQVGDADADIAWLLAGMGLFSLASIHYWRNGLDFDYVDVGANVGLTTIAQSVFFKRCDKANKTYAFQPGRVFSLLERSVKLNRIDDMTTCHPVALTDRDGLAKFYLTPAQTAASSLLVEATERPGVVTSIETVVETIKFDHFANRMRPAAGLLAKIDAEGADFNVLDGMRQTLANRVCTIQIELYPALADPYTNCVDRLHSLAADFVLIDVGASPPVEIGSERSDIMTFVNDVRKRAVPATDVFLVPKKLPRFADLVRRIITGYVSSKSGSAPNAGGASVTSSFQSPMDSSLRILVKRRGTILTMKPAEYNTFTFMDGDVIEISPPEIAVKLPTYLGVTNLEVQPGKAIRVPPVYKFSDFKGFKLPEHLVALTGTGSDQFDSVGKALLGNYQRHVPFSVDASIVDVGCGIGRLAFQLLDFVSPRGHYTGIDVCLDSITWCRRNISAQRPNFSFHHLDAFSEVYNPFGRFASTELQLPIPDRSVDRVFAGSLFTHLMEDEVIHYLQEFRRILRSESFVYTSFFLYSRAALESAKVNRKTSWVPTFAIDHGHGVYGNDPDHLRGGVAFTDEAMRRMIEKAGLVLDLPYLKGWWSGLYGDNADDGQDVAVLRLP
jgi:FkbM family methyltransferase